MALPDISRLPLQPQERFKQSTFSHGTPCATATNGAAANAAAAATNALNAAIAEEERTKSRTVAHVPYFDLLLNAESLSVSQNMLYWASECLPYVQHLPIEQRFVTQAQELLEILELSPMAQEFYGRMSKPGGITATANRQFNFWLQFSWLACFFSIRREYDMVFVMEPPHSWGGSNKHYWWSTHLAGSPFYAAINTPLTRGENILTAFADQYRNAAAAAARAVNASNLANTMT